MSPEAYFRIFGKRLWVLILGVTLGIAAALVVAQVQEPVYRSTVYLNVRPRRLDWGLQQTIKGLLRNYALNVTSRATAVQVIDTLGLSTSPDALRGQLHVTPIESDFMLRLDADDRDPARAQQIAQTTAEYFVERIHAYMLKQDKQDRVEVTMRDYALPGTLYRPKLRMYVLAGAMVGFFGGLATALLLRWFESDCIESRRELDLDMPELQVIGVIPEA